MTTEWTRYAIRLVTELDEFTKSPPLYHQVKIRRTGRFALCTVTVTEDELSPKVVIDEAKDGGAAVLGLLKDRLRERFSQWIYIQRGLRIFDGPHVHICKVSRLIDWTEAQAIGDADDIIADALLMGG